MWCNCVNLPETKLGCANIPYSSNPSSPITIRVYDKREDEYIDFSQVDDAFFVIRKQDDINATNFTILSIANGSLSVDSVDSRKLKVTYNADMLQYVNDVLFYLFFVKINDENRPLMTGKFFKENNYL